MTILPQPYGIRIEMILAKGYSTEEAVRLIRRADPAELAGKVSSEASWDGFAAYARDNGDTLEAAVREGYRLSFLTIGGLASLLSAKFGKKQDEDFRIDAGRIEGLRLTQAEIEALRSLVPAYWKFDVEDSPDDGQPSKVRIEHASLEG